MTNHNKHKEHKEPMKTRISEPSATVLSFGQLDIIATPAPRSYDYDITRDYQSTLLIITFLLHFTVAN